MTTAAEADSVFRSHLSMTLVVSGILLLSFAIESNGDFYGMLRFVVTAYCFFNILVFLEEVPSPILRHCRWAFIALGVLFNPLIPVYFHSKGIWLAIDVLAMMFFWSFVAYQRRLSKSVLPARPSPITLRRAEKRAHRAAESARAERLRRDKQFLDVVNQYLVERGQTPLAALPQSVARQSPQSDDEDDLPF